MDSSSLSALEHIRLRPQMYIGSTNRLGVEIVVFEAIDNAIDQYLGKHATELNVDINDKHVIVSDDGAGYPFDLRDSNNFSIGESYLTQIHNRNTADDHSPHVHCLTFGCGVFCLNALTESLVISTWRNGELWRQEYSRGIAFSAPRVIEKGTGRGTTVDFVIDSQIFPEPLVNVSSLAARLKLCAYLFPGLKIRFQQENFCSRNGLADRVHDQMCEFGSSRFRCLENVRWRSTPIFYVQSETEDFSLQAAAFGETTTKTVFETFANGARSVEEGTHCTSFRQVLSRRVRWRPEYATISVVMKKPTFSGPTKTRLDMPSMKNPFVEAISPALREFCKQNRIGKYALE